MTFATLLVVLLPTFVIGSFYAAFNHVGLSSHTKIGRGLILVGTSTLEIYLLHYFVLPRHMESWVDAMGLAENPLLALLVNLLLAVAVIGVVLVVKVILQSNSWVRKWLWNK